MENTREYRVGETVSLNGYGISTGMGAWGKSGTVMAVSVERSQYSTLRSYAVYHVNTGVKVMKWSEFDVEVS